jgi:hypothetical protein
VWPGITPLNVWHLPLPIWLRYAGEADRWVAEQKRLQRKGG